MMWAHLAEPLCAEYRIDQNIRERRKRIRTELLADLYSKWNMVEAKIKNIDGQILKER